MLSTSRYFYTAKAADELRPLGFIFIKTRDRDDFVVQNNPTITLNSLEELVAFTRKWGEIVFSESGIEIYNDNRE